DICDVYLWRWARFLLAHRSSFAACLPYYTRSGPMQIEPIRFSVRLILGLVPRAESALIPD
ncbi:MAG TPA: hypothetical protein VFU22_34250, partial [Roseiflexaceae bacterium]|nr:hypothetical protein [Roseiflexaceae bacterium]